MRRLTKSAFLAISLATPAVAAQASERIILTTAADNWEKAFPVGNGRLAAMVFGRVDEERIQVNEETVWEGSATRDHVRDGAREGLEQIRNLIWASRPLDAEQHAVRSQPGNPADLMSYQTMGDIRIRRMAGEGPASNYVRELDLPSGVATTRYDLGQRGSVTQSVFASSADNVLVVHISHTDERPHRYIIDLARPDGKIALPSGNSLAMSFTLASNGPGEAHGLDVFARLDIVASGARVSVEGTQLVVEGKGDIILLYSAATSYRGTNPKAEVEAHLRKARTRSIGELTQRHRTAFSRRYGSVRLQLGEDDPETPTDQRIKAVRAGASDPDLYGLFAQFGRYLLLSSSAEGTTPANLQGKWNDYLAAPWNSDYHMNINLQMNYWLAGPGALPDASLGLVEWIEGLAEAGTATAREQYGARGWVAHHTSDIFHRTTPERAVWANWPMAGAWAALALAEHNRFYPDRKFASERAYPVLRGAALFLLDTMQTVPDGLPGAGSLVTNPSQSPENKYLQDGKPAVLTYGSTADIQIVREVWHSTLELLAETRQHRGDERFDQALEAEIRAALARLPAPIISPRDGRLQEWIADFEEAEPGHRHIAHSFGLHPGREIAPDTQPELVAALRKTIAKRLENGGGGTGWSRAWLANMFARLHEGNEAHAQLSVLVGRASQPNLLTTHPPFQIDGNLGGAAAVFEMLAQSHLGMVHLLPAIPAAWPEGSVTGMRLRGGHSLGLAWQGGALAKASITPGADTVLRIRASTRLRVVTSDGTPIAATYSVLGDDTITSFNAKASLSYQLLPAIADAISRPEPDESQRSQKRAGREMGARHANNGA